MHTFDLPQIMYIILLKFVQPKDVFSHFTAISITGHIVKKYCLMQQNLKFFQSEDTYFLFLF